MTREQSVLSFVGDVLWRRRGFAAACFSLVLLGTIVATFTAKPIYRAKSVVQIEQPSGFVLRTDIFGAGFTRTLPQEQAELVDTYPYKSLVDSVVTISAYLRIPLSKYQYSEQIRSLFETVLCDVPGATDTDSCIAYHAARIEGHPHPEPKDENEFQQDVRARLVEDTGLIELFAEAPSPIRAQNAANAAALVLVWQNEQLRKQEARNTIRFIRSQLDAPGGIKAQLARADEKLAAFKRQNAFLDAQEETRVLLQQILDISNRRWQAVVRMADLRTRLAAIRKQLGTEPSTMVSPTIYENPTVQEIKKQLVAAEADLLALQAQFTDEHPRVQSALARVASLRDHLRQEALRIESVQRLPNPVYQELYKNVALLSSDIVGQEAQMTALDSTLNNLQRRMLAVPELERQLTRLLRERQALERQYLFLMERLQEAELTQAVKLGNARVVELAQLPGKRVKPRRVLNTLMGTLLGMVLAIGFVLLLEHVDRRLPCARLAAEWLDMPLLAVIPTSPDNISNLASHPNAVEALRRLRAAVRLSSLEHPLRTLMVTSASPGEGKTFVVRHLGTSIAQTGRRVLLVDAQLREPSLHRDDGLAQSPGLTEWLLGQSDLSQCLRATATSNLWILPAGTRSPNPTELLESNRIPELLTQLSQEYDLVIVDAPAADRFVDPQILALYCDAVIVVIQPGKTRRDVAQVVVETLRALPGTRLLGLVANQVRDFHKETFHYSATRRRTS